MAAAFLRLADTLNCVSEQVLGFRSRIADRVVEDLQNRGLDSPARIDPHAISAFARETFGRTCASRKLGMAIAARIAMMATTRSNSIKVKP